jgi:hypothetical protein
MSSRKECTFRFASTSLMPSRPAFGVEPSVCPRRDAEGHNDRAYRLRSATMRAEPRLGWTGVLVQPMDNPVSTRCIGDTAERFVLDSCRIGRAGFPGK